MLLDKLKKFASREAPTILSCLGVLGFVASTVMAVRVTEKALEVEEEVYREDERDGYSRSHKELRMEIIRRKAPLYAPAAGLSISSAAMVLGSAHMARRRYIAISGLYVASQRYLSKLEEKMVERVGLKKADEIHAEANAPDKDVDIPEEMLSGSHVLCYDVTSDRYFTMESIEALRSVESYLNVKLREEMFVEVNDFYYEVGLKKLSYGDQFGWAIEDGHISIRFDPALTQYDRPCVSVSFRTMPKHIFQKFGRS